MKVPFALPDIGAQEIEEAIQVMRSGWLTTGARTLQFERDFTAYVGARHCMAVNSGTAALHLALEAAGVGPGDEVVVPVHTFTATAEVVRYLGADPLFVDCDRETFCMDPLQIQGPLETRRAGSREQRAKGQEGKVKAIMPVHFGGHPCDMDGVLGVSSAEGIKVVEDAAHAFPAYYRGKPDGVRSEDKEDEGSASRAAGTKKMVGTIGDATCFSFYASKTITTGEGGMLATDDDDIAKRVRVMRLHGIDRDIWNRYSDTNADWVYDVVAPGFKYNMTDLAAALGIHQLAKAEKFRARREFISRTYFDELSGIPGLILPRIRCAMEDHAWHLYVVLIEPKETSKGINRDRFIQKMKDKSIGTSVHFIPLHRMTYYRERYKLEPEMFPNSEWVFQRCVSLPIFSAMTDAQIQYVVDSIREILGT